MIRVNSFTMLLSATLLGAAVASGAAAQSISASRFEARPFLGAYLPTGAHREVLGDAITIGAQGGYAITEHISLVATFGFAASSDKHIPLDDDLDLFSYDIGAELTKSFLVGSGVTLSPFIGLGAGGRTYDYRERETDSETNVAGYGAIGGQLRMGTIGVRIEARDYVSSFKGLTGEMTEWTSRNDISIFTALSLSF